MSKRYRGEYQTDLGDFRGYVKKVWWLKPNRFRDFGDYVKKV